MRTTKSHQLEAISEGGGRKANFLGKEGKIFEFTDVMPIKVEFAASSAQNGELDELQKWLETVA